MELPRKLIDEIKKFQLKYAKRQCVPKYEIYALSEINETEITRICRYFKENYVEKIKYETLREELQTFVKNMEDLYQNDTKILVYDYLKKFDNMENENYICHLLEIFFQQIHQDIPSLKKHDFDNLVRIFSSYIKFETVINQIKNNKTPSKESLRQLLECILYKRFSRHDCHQTVFNKIGNFEYEFVKFDLKSLDEGSGFLGDHFKLEVTIKHENKNKIFDFFMKFLPKGTGPWDILALRGFKKEMFVYSEMIPQLQKFGAENLVNFAPQCYLSKENEVIVLENLTPLGYTFMHLNNTANYKWMVSVIKQLSKFHAGSFILEEKIIRKSGKVLLGDLYTEYFNELIFEKNGLLGFSYGKDLVNSYFIDEAAELWKEVSVDEFKKKFLTASEKVFKDVTMSEKYYNVICHGDLHGRNVLSHESQESYLIDFQLLRFCPPALELQFLIYMSTSRELRKEHMAEFTEIYYHFLKQYLDSHNVDITQFYTWEKFSESVNCYKSSSILMVLLYLQINLYPSELVKEYDNSPEKIKQYYHEERSQLFREKIKNLIVDLYDIYKNDDTVR